MIERFEISINKRYNEVLLKKCILALSVRYSKLRIAIVEKQNGLSLIIKNKLIENQISIFLTENIDAIHNGIDYRDFPLFNVAVLLRGDSFCVVLFIHQIISCELDIEHCIMYDLVYLYINEGKNYWKKHDFDLVHISQRILDQFSLDVEDIIPLSYKQRALLSWSLALKTKGLFVKLNHITFQISNFDLLKFIKSINMVVDNNEILRCIYKGRLQYQVIFRSVKTDVTYLDFSGQSEKQQIVSLDKISDQIMEQGFDYLNETLLKCKIIKLKDNLYDFITFHHFSIMDGISYRIFVNSVYQCYSLLVDGAEIIPKESNYKFKDYIIEEMRSVNNSCDREFWSNKIYGLKTRYDFEHLNEYKNENASNYYCFLNANQEKKVRDIINQFSVPRSLIFFAPYFLVCKQLLKETKVTIGMVTNTWQHSGDYILGYYSNILPYYIEISEFMNIQQILNFLYEQLIEYKEHELYPINNLCNICFSYENSYYGDSNNRKSNEVKFVSSIIETKGSTNHDLYLSVKEKREGIMICVECKENCFTENALKEIVDLYVGILVQMI